MNKYLLQRRGFLPTANFTIGQNLTDENGKTKIHLLQIKPAAPDVGTIEIQYPNGTIETFDLSVESRDEINANPVQVVAVLSTTLTINQDFKLYE